MPEIDLEINVHLRKGPSLTVSRDTTGETWFGVSGENRPINSKEASALIGAFVLAFGDKLDEDKSLNQISGE